ncbi:MAG: glycosyltransferase [Bacteroidales bacterium]|nr:glycosyltransferase [Bacteroidales bacterium]
MKKVIVSVTNDLITDQRVHRVCSTLHGFGFNVLLVGRKLKNSLAVDKRNYSTVRLKLLFTRGFLFYAEYNIRLFFYLLFHKEDILLSNDLDTLPANFLVKKIKNKILVFDSHEYFPEVPELSGRKFTKNFWLKIEKFILPKIKHAYTVNGSLAGIYKEKYNTDFKVIRNVPYKNEDELKKIDFSGFKGKKIILYQGALNIGRGIEELIKTMKYIENAVFLIIGDGDISNELKNLVNELKFENKVRFFGKIPLSELKSYTKYADIGISLEENMGLNYYYSLPNKLFDYIQSKVPVLVSDFPEMANIVNKYNIGIILKERTIEKIAEKINLMLNNNDLRSEWKKNLEFAAGELCWENEEKELIKLFNEIVT